jgi:putative ABC transport system substrate-binding protein
LQDAEAASAKLGTKLYALPIRTLEDFEEAFARATRQHVDGLFIMPTSLSRSQRTPLAKLALEYRLPSMFGAKENVEAGGLMSYAADYVDLTRRAATYIDKILKGAKPADLPVEQASKYLFVINLKTAKALGLAIPPTVLARADEVIE